MSARSTYGEQQSLISYLCTGEDTLDEIDPDAAQQGAVQHRSGCIRQALSLALLTKVYIVTACLLVL